MGALWSHAATNGRKTLRWAWVCVMGCATPTLGDAPTDGEEVPTVETEPSDEPVGTLSLCINEFMPSNESSYEDAGGEFPDWLELHNPGAVDVNLDGWAVTDDREEPYRHVLQGGLVVPAGGYLLLFPDGQPEIGPDHLSFALGVDGEDIGIMAPSGAASVIGYGALAADVSAARSDDCCSELDCWGYVFGGTPGVTNIIPEPPIVEYDDLIVEGSNWRYADVGFDLGTAWTEVSYLDGSWPEGAGPLGYGDGHHVTTVSYGPDPNNKYPTTYFRHPFTVGAGGLDFAAVLRLGLMRDDGAIVYLNDTELVRSNMPAGSVDYWTYAAGTAEAAAETSYEVHEVDVNLLVEGDNVLAVEVHQANSTSSDISFDLYLELERQIPAENIE